jgi:hypothetical protein
MRSTSSPSAAEEPGGVATRARPRRIATPAGRRALVPAALFAAAALISGFTMLRGLDPFDEGLMLQAARRVGDGQLPYRDFLWAYGPAQPYLLGGLFKAFGVSLIDWRILRVLADAGVALVVYAIARREAGPRVALAGWLAAACVMAQPRSANPFPLALLAGLGAVALITAGPPTRRRVAGAAALTALAAAFRLDFAIYAGVAVAVALVAGRQWRAAAGYAGLTAGLTLVVYLPFLVAIGPADLYDALVGGSLREKEYWTLPFPWAYDGGLGGLRDAKDVLDFYVPVLLVAGFAVAAVATALRLRADVRRPPAAWLALLAFAAGGVAYLLSRTDEFHTTPLFVVLAVLLPIIIARGGPRPVALLAAAVLGLLVLQGTWNRASALLRPPELAPVDVAVADGAKAPPAEARSLARMVRLVQERVPPGHPIYVAPRRSDLVRFNAPLVYVLTERDNPTRRDFGLETSAAAQAEIVATLRRVRPKAVVRWTDPIQNVQEPNLRGRPSGVHTVDDYLAIDYRLLERAGYYDVLVPR